MGLPALHEDYLFLGPLLQARLREQLPDLPCEVCETAEQIYAADKRSQVLMVMWAGDRFNETEAGRASIASQKLWQRWLVLLCLGNVSQAKDARQRGAGPLMSQVHRALAGWVPAGCVLPLRRASAPMRPDITPAKAIYPMGFEISLSL